MIGTAFPDYSLLTHKLRLASTDVALARAFVAANSDLIEAFRALDAVADSDREVKAKPLPGIGEITAVQAAIFDNWPSGKRVKNYPNRFGFALEVWTVPRDEINVAKGNYQHKISVPLMNRKSLAEWTKRTAKQNAARKQPLGADYLAKLTTLPDCMGEDDYVAVCASKQHKFDGTVYFDDQWLLVTMVPEGASACLFIREEPFRLPGFSPLGADGKPLRGRVISQSRADRVGFSKTWATGDCGVADEVEDQISSLIGR